MFVVALLLGCTGSAEKDAETLDTSVSSDEEWHPLVPEDQRYFWETSGCDNRSRTYIVGDASSDADGSITVTESHVRFYGGEDDDWEDDCVDVYTYEGSAMTRSELNNVEATTYEEGWAVERELTEGGCSGGWGDGSGDYLFVFDTLTANGQLNVDNGMLVLQYTKGGWGGDDEEWKADTDYARGVYHPEDQENPMPPASYEWMGGGGCGW